MKALLCIVLAFTFVAYTHATADCPADKKPIQTACKCGTVDPCAAGKVCTDATANKCEDAPPADAAGAAEAPLRCQAKDGKLLPSATICADKLDPTTCEAVFGGAAAAADVDCKKAAGTPEPADCNCKAGDKGNACKAGSTCDAAAGTCTPPGKRKKRQAAAAAGGKRSDKCDLPELADFALQCAKTCKICCETAEYGCEDDASFGIDCQQQKSKCKIPQWTAVMSTACPLTCGLCNAGACKDTIAGCSSLKTLCRDFTYRTYMSQNCARTCKACDQSGGGGAIPPPVNCVDTGNNCVSFTSWCQGTADQRSTMQTSCKKTCGFC